MRLLKAPPLRKGDLIGLIAPASPPPSEARIQAGVRYLEARGYRVRLGQYVTARHGYFAGTDRERAEDLNGMFRCREVRAIFALRGGYGCPRLLPMVDYSAVRRQPKIFVGFSDVTALQLALFRRTGLVTFSGLLAAVELAQTMPPGVEESFWRLLTSTRRPPSISCPAASKGEGRKAVRAQGCLLGGNLSLVTASLGTPYSPDYRDALLVLEDVHEHFHRLDRMFTQLRNARVLSRIAGLILGQFTDCTPSRPGEPHLNLEEILAEVTDWLKVPVLRDFPYGHQKSRVSLPLGVQARLNLRRGQLEFLESAVAG